MPSVATPTGLGRPAAMLFAQVPDVVLIPVLRSLGLDPAAQPRAGRSVAALLADPYRVEALLAEVDPAERDVLDRLAAGPPLGTLRNAFATTGDTPAHALIARGLLVPGRRVIGRAAARGRPGPARTPPAGRLRDRP